MSDISADGPTTGQEGILSFASSGGKYSCRLALSVDQIRPGFGGN